MQWLGDDLRFRADDMEERLDKNRVNKVRGAGTQGISEGEGFEGQQEVIVSPGFCAWQWAGFRNVI